MKKWIVLFIASLAILLFPITAFAVDFTINETNIEAFLQENGDVEVSEFHTYEFDGEFNGITRSIIPKSGTSIKDFQAVENGLPLKIEQEDELYRIFRAGDSETILIEINYTITNGVEVFADMAQFHWPFFDSSNESDYEEMTISVHPPNQAFDVLAYGDNEAYNTETILDDGTVIFSMGYVRSGTDGNIRVAFENSLFPAVPTISDKSIRHDILNKQQTLADDYLNYKERQGTVNNIAPFAVGVFGVFLLGLLFFAWRKKQMTDHEAERIYHSSSIVPKEIMSMPATIYYYRKYLVGYGELMTIGMMDLIRKGNIEARSDEKYYRVHSKTEHKHENSLLKLLFDKIGRDNTFTFKQLKKFSESTKDQHTFNTAVNGYQKELLEEIHTHDLYDSHKKLRWTTAILSLLLIPLMIIFGIYQLFMWLFISLGIMVALLVFAIAFNPKTPEGKVIKKRWKQFEKEFEELEENNWRSLASDDKERALLFSSGLANKKLKEKNKQFIESYENQDNSAMTLLLLLTLSTTGSSSFGSATNVAASSGGSFTGSGSGVGGGGGGSGAF
ncbi:DUF2207 domain-containing protein [Oceanobacillus sp. CAU 1775]